MNNGVFEDSRKEAQKAQKGSYAKLSCAFCAFLRPSISFVCILLSPVFPQPVFAQLSEEELRRERIEVTEDLERTEKLSVAATRARKDRIGWMFDYGFTSSVAYTASGNNDRNQSALDDPDHTWDNDINAYAVAENMSRSTKYYFRTKTLRTDPAKVSGSTREMDMEQLKIDMLYAQREFQGAKAKHKLTFGRQFSKVGRGIAYGLTADGLHWQTKGKKMTATALWMRQNPGDNNIDNLSPGSGRTKRWFFGAEYKHKFKKWFAADAFLLWNIDRNTEDAYAVTGLAGSLQQHKYNSQFLGFGSDGTFFSKFNYWWEYIRVSGKTYDAARNGQLTAKEVSVDGEAFDLGGRYLFGGDLSPTVFAEYAFGSGDADRISNVTSSQRGSTDGKDSVFRSFGGLTMGHALAPSLSNIRIAKLGGSAKPFGRMGAARWSDMTANLTLYSYWAYAKGGATSDPFIATSTNARSNDIGNEYDLTVSWKLFNDVNYQLKYGMFAPGEAYANRGHETYMKMKVSFDL